MSALAFIALAETGAWCQTSEPAAPEIGTAVAIKSIVMAKLGEDEHRLKVGGRVHRSELLNTGAEASAELKLDDNTKIALGPNASIRLDDFVVGQKDGVTTIAVNFVKGTFRFLTGNQGSQAYKIETPSATIGVRGTVFDVYVDGSGDTLVLLHEGEVDICSRQKNCRQHKAVGQIVHATVGGVLSAPLKFTKGLIPGLSVGRAFPFVGKSLSIDPVRRLKAADLVAPVTRPVREIGRGAGSIGRSIRGALPF